MSLPVLVVEELFKAHERFLWGLCYRMTGNAADADDLVQETFVRVMKTPPARTDEPLRPWLVKVAVNLSRDLLRLRRRPGYDGTWLPAPIETDDELSPPAHEPADEKGNPATRYEMIESVSFAFLLALEALTPAQRAVLLLRDVFDYSVSETAEALGMSEASVKTTHHRARRGLSDYDRARIVPNRSLQEQTRAAMERLLTCLFNHDADGAASLLAEDARHLSDGGGEFIAARVPVVGRDKVILFNSRIAQLADGKLSFEWRILNGLPALVIDYPDVPKGAARRQITTCELDAQGQIKRIYSVLATRKLTAISRP
jgi:RNA polymerase sigma-70 factor (ECF subfamily)